MKQVVVIEDDPALSDFFVKRLAERGYNTVQARHTSDTLVMIRELTPLPDLVLSGQPFGSEQELNVLQYLKQSDDLKHIPVVLIVPIPSEELFSRLFRQGASDVWITGQVYEEGISQYVANFFSLLETASADDWHVRAANMQLSDSEIRAIVHERMDALSHDKERMQRYIAASKRLEEKKARKKLCPVCGYEMEYNDTTCPACGNMTF